MSEFSESYHLFTSGQEEAVDLIRESGLRGFALAPENGWVSFVVDEGEFARDPRVTEKNRLCLLHYVNAEDHGWSFELFEGPQSVCRYRCDWDNEVRPDISDFRPVEVSRLLGPEVAERIGALVPQLTPGTIDELFEHETPYDFARALALPHYEWFSYDGVAASYGRGNKDYAGCVEVAGRKA
jgi:hypothetical protein